MVTRRYQQAPAMLVAGCMVLLLAPPILGYPKGAPASACLTGVPLHASNGVTYEPQTSPPPYQIDVDVAEFRTGDTITVNISSDQGVPFRGLFMQVRPVRNATEDVDFKDQPLGRFIRFDDDKNTKPLTCLISLETETHTDKFAKYNLTIKWRSPLLVRNDVVVRATLVANFSTFWTNVESPRIRNVGGERLPVDKLEHMWLKEVAKTVTAKGDKMASRELVKARFKRGYKDLIDPHGFIMVQYVTDILPFEDRFSNNTLTTSANANVSGTKTRARIGLSPVFKTEAEGRNTNTGGLQPRVSGQSQKLHYESLVKSLLNGDKGVVEELTTLMNDHEH